MGKLLDGRRSGKIDYLWICHSFMSIFNPKNGGMVTERLVSVVGGRP